MEFSNRVACGFCFAALAILVPALAHGQDSGLSGVNNEIGSLQATLEQAYTTLIVHCSELIGIGQGIAGFGALWYIADKVFGHLARAERVDVQPLLRPFAIGLVIVLFPSVIGLINGVMQPTVSGTAALVDDANQAVATLLQQKADALKNSSNWQMYVGANGSGDLDKWEALSGEADSGVFSGLSNRVKFEMAKVSYNMKNSVKVWMSEVLQTLFEAVALCINTVRTFYLVILAIFGPLAFGLGTFPGFGAILGQWLSQYIKVFLWLPIANIFGSLIAQVQQTMIKLDIAQLAASGQTTFSPTDTAYIIFLLMAIVGYCTVPTISNRIVLFGNHAAHDLRLKLAPLKGEVQLLN
jgi:conjugative transposon TraJ protein